VSGFEVQGVRPSPQAEDRRQPGALDYAYLVGPSLTVLPLPAVFYLSSLNAAPTNPWALLGAVVLGSLLVIMTFVLLRDGRWRGTGLETLRVVVLATPWGLLLFAMGMFVLVIEPSEHTRPPPWLLLPLPAACALAGGGAALIGAWALRLRGFGEGDRPARAPLRDHLRAWSRRPAVAAALGLWLPGLGHLVTGRRRRGWSFLLGALVVNGVLLAWWLNHLRQLGFWEDPQRVAEASPAEVFGLEGLVALGLFAAGWWAFLVWEARDAYRGAQRP
jgi:hypothetical protein